MLELRPINFKDACVYIKDVHRHHNPPQGWKFGIACYNDSELVGVVTVGRPVARMLDNGVTAEVTRLCTDGTANVCSMLYSAAWRAAKSMGYKRIITYILESETGTSLKASNWRFLYNTKGHSWNCNVRKRTDDHPLCNKLCYGIGDTEDLINNNSETKENA